MAFLAVAVVLSSIAGALYKLSTCQHGAAISTLLATRIASTMVALAYFPFSHRTAFDGEVLRIALLAGGCVVLGRWALLIALRYGKMATTWAIGALSLGIPVAVAILDWGERPDALKVAGLALMPVALLLLSEKPR